jgi:thymidylate kinase
VTATANTPALGARLARLFRRLDEAQIPWCLLRPAQGLAERSGDVDLLVEPASVAAVRWLVAGAGFGLLPRGGHDVHAVNYDEQSDELLWIHIQPALELGGVSVPARPILATVVRDSLPRPADSWLFWILLLHVLEKETIAVRHRASLTQLARAAGVEHCPLAAIPAARGMRAERLVGLARQGDWDGLTRAGSVLQRQPMRVRARRRIGSVRERFTADRARGLTVAVIGPDGAGKTTLVASLTQTLPVPTRVIYMGLTGGLIPCADALRLPGLVFAARLVILAGRHVRARWHRARGRIALFERHTLDGHVPSGIPLRMLARLSRRLQARVIPPPDLVLLLDASGATMFGRANEYDPETLEDWRSAYRRLEQRLRTLVVIDAEQPSETVRREAQAHILSRYSEIRARP